MDKRPARVVIVAGEASADRYAARLVECLRASSQRELQFFGTGGDRMDAAGVRLLCHIRELAHIGPREALGYLGLYYRTYRRLIRETAADRPAVALLLDFPDFNLRLARPLHRMGIPVVYYIGPQLWAWRGWRIRTVRKFVDRMLVILPFEEDYYQSRGVKAEYVGHPILEDFAPRNDRNSFLERLGLDPRRATVALLPGSRRREVEHMLPDFLRAARLVRQRIDAQFLVSVAPSVDVARVEQIARSTLGPGDHTELFSLVREDARDILANSDFAMVKSGTSTLEAALIGTPFLIAYRLSAPSALAGRLLVRSRFKGLVNLIAGWMVVPEYLQADATPEKLAAAAIDFLNNPARCARMRESLAAVRGKLGSRVATEIVAERVLGYLQAWRD